MFDYEIILYIIFGILPSLVWLSYYLAKDTHPEPKEMVLRIFLWGMMVTSPVFFIQVGLKFLLDQSTINPFYSNLIYWFLIIALSEELFKYLVIKVKVSKSMHLDEPLDVMLYMTISALGFAALENILYLFAPAGTIFSLGDFINRTLIVSFVRFIGATFLHTLCSAIVGYFVAMSFAKENRKYIFATIGVLLAALLHGTYDFFIMELSGYAEIASLSIMILTLALVVFFMFKKLKKMKGICYIKIKNN